MSEQTHRASFRRSMPVFLLSTPAFAMAFSIVMVLISPCKTIPDDEKETLLPLGLMRNQLAQEFNIFTRRFSLNLILEYVGYSFFFQTPLPPFIRLSPLSRTKLPYTVVPAELQVQKMVDYSKWDNFDSESGSDSDGAAAQQQQKTPQQQKRQGVQQRSSNAGIARILDRAENLR